MQRKSLAYQPKFYVLLFIFAFGSIALAVAQEKPQLEKRWLRLQVIEVARKTLVDSIWRQLQKDEPFPKLARMYSIHASSKMGGEIEWLNPDSMNSELRTVIEFLPIGSVSPIFKKENLFLIFNKIDELPEIDYFNWKKQKFVVDSLLARIYLLINTGNYTEAFLSIKHVDKRVERFKDQKTNLYILEFKGAVALGQGNFNEAISIFDRFLQMARKNGDIDRIGRALGNLGNAYFPLAKYPQAIAYFDSALIIARKIHDRQKEGRHLGNLGSVYLSLAQYYLARTYIDSALAIAREIRDSSNIASQLGNLGIFYKSLNKYSQAISYFDSALVIAQTIGDHSGEERRLGNLGNLYISLAQYSRAIKYYKNALVIARKSGNRNSEGKWLGNLGEAYRLLAQNPSAMAYYDSALVTARTIGDRSGEGKWLGNLGNVYASLGQYIRAIVYYHSAQVIAREIGDKISEGMWLGNLGSVCCLLGQHSKAIAYYDSALILAKGIGDRRGEGTRLGNLGYAYFLSDQYSKAIVYTDSALFIENEINDSEGIWRRYWVLAKSYAKVPRTQSYRVIDSYERAVSVLESITGQLVEDVSKLSFLENKQKLYADYINYLVAQSESKNYARALEISEASRTRALRDLLQGQRIQNPLAVEKRVAAMKRTEELFQAYTAAQVGRDKLSDALRASVDDSLETWAAQIQIPPDTLGSTEGAPAIRMREIQAEAKTSTLLEYHVLDDGVAIWVVNQSGKVFSLKQNIPKAKLEALIDSARQALGVGSFSFRNVKPATSGKKTQPLAYKPILQTLDTLLIQPVARYLPPDSSRELTILPHDILFLLPFSSLIDNTGKYLVERYTFSTAPSVGLLKFTRGRIREQQYRDQPKLLLLGNPEMPDTKLWPLLPGAEQEVKRIAQNVNQKKGAGFQAKGALALQALPLIKAQATEAEFRRIASVQNYLHLATHGYVVSDALRSGLVLAKTGNTMETDGILTTAEVFGLQLNAELVVLSACQTGLGQISSDGVAGLSRAFLYAGASSLIVSLWQVPDAATQHLMVKFYEELARDSNKARALRAAQLHTMKKYSHPRDWAAFVLVGQPK